MVLCQFATFTLFRISLQKLCGRTVSFITPKANEFLVIVILAVVILPFTFLRSPGEFWGVVVIAMATTVIAVLSILIGIFLFAFSGHYVFPTIQHDMKNPHEFTKSVAVGFFLVVLLYMPLSVMGYVVYGSSLESSVIYSIQTGYLQVTVKF
ncbi:unnamed protein product [Haemonchus placei]|uniref:Aa_trans domain-containing protein n=1 Tax=Haemonchus placei TaxID=6290 RepID=A0A0N4X8J9_HAEPC|nr:unnamed protein product [Haemonchus placei]